MTRPRYDNVLRKRLAAREFVVSVEFVTPEASEPFEAAIAPILTLAEQTRDDPRFHTIAVTDRVKSDDDHDPVRVAARIAEASGKAPTVHVSGKDRDAATVGDLLRRARDAGLENLLVVTGDRVKGEYPDRRVRYLDSVLMTAQARALDPGFHVAAAVSPFKYREEDLSNQYLKMVKKERAGADCFITQVGWDMLKFKELVAYRRRRGLPAPVMAGLMLLTAPRARYIRTHKLAGITVTAEFQARLEADARGPDKGLGAAYGRLALQIVGLHRLGFAGFQLTGIHALDKLEKLLGQAEALDAALGSEADWWEAWWETLRGPDGAPTPLAPPEARYLFRELGEPEGWKVPLDDLTLRDPSPADRTSEEFRRYVALDRLDRVVFKKGSVGAAVAGSLARLVPRGSAVERGLHLVEARIKGPLVGCETCGFCRLPHTFYVCPETCPKGLANGPCGGTSENTCEFGDRECVHSGKYRIAKAAGRLDDLERELIPGVEAGRRGTCSWTSHFRGDDPAVTFLEPVGSPASPR